LIELKRRKFTIHYHKEKYECDFEISIKNRVVILIQVCYKQEDENFGRKRNGISEAAAFLFQLLNTFHGFDGVFPIGKG
jgi:hypothetical protein